MWNQRGPAEDSGFKVTFALIAAVHLLALGLLLSFSLHPPKRVDNDFVWVNPGSFDGGAARGAPRSEPNPTGSGAPAPTAVPEDGKPAPDQAAGPAPGAETVAPPPLPPALPPADRLPSNPLLEPFPPAATPAPTPAATPVPTAVSRPSAALTPKPKPTPKAKPTPKSAPVPSPVLTPSPSPVSRSSPRGRPSSEPTPKPSLSPKLTPTPKATPEAKPSPSPAASPVQERETGGAAGAVAKTGKGKGDADETKEGKLKNPGTPAAEPGEKAPRTAPANSQGPGGPAAAGHRGEADGGSGRGQGSRSGDLSGYAQTIKLRFDSAWDQPRGQIPPGSHLVATVRLKIQPDGTVSEFTLMQGSGNPVVDETVRDAGRKITRLPPPPGGEVFSPVIRFELGD
ncbi:MAG TPA: TonB family protein [Chthoniobacterales bacterium]